MQGKECLKRNNLKILDQICVQAKCGILKGRNRWRRKKRENESKEKEKRIKRKKRKEKKINSETESFD